MKLVKEAKLFLENRIISICLSVSFVLQMTFTAKVRLQRCARCKV